MFNFKQIAIRYLDHRKPMSPELLNVFFILAIILYLIGRTIWESAPTTGVHFFAATLAPGLFLLSPFIDSKPHLNQTLITVGIGYLLLALIARIKDNRNNEWNSWLNTITLTTGGLGLIFCSIGIMNHLLQ